MNNPHSAIELFFPQAKGLAKLVHYIRQNVSFICKTKSSKTKPSRTFFSDFPDCFWPKTRFTILREVEFQLRLFASHSFISEKTSGTQFRVLLLSKSSQFLILSRSTSQSSGTSQWLYCRAPNWIWKIRPAKEITYLASYHRIAAPFSGLCRSLEGVETHNEIRTRKWKM